jgi:hypothetical protein
MKTVLLNSGELKRVSDSEAHRLVEKGHAEYAPKSLYKRQQMMEKVSEREGDKTS